ncbi:MAG: hypothetical protein ACI4A8_05030 [Muribaculaceae bacterium]
MKSILPFIFLLSSMCLLLSSCSNDNGDAEIFRSPSYRDGTYSGSQLTVNLNATAVTTIQSVTMQSMQDGFSYITNALGDTIGFDPEYNSTVTINGLFKKNDKYQFTTRSNFSGFSGATTINGKEYTYTGSFTGDPLSKHSEQGLKLELTTK